MSRQDSKSLKIRGVPPGLLDGLDAHAARASCSRNAILRGVIEGYASGQLQPARVPPAFEPERQSSAYPLGTATRVISGIPATAWAEFIGRAKSEGWFSKNELIVELIAQSVDE